MGMHIYSYLTAELQTIQKLITLSTIADDTSHRKGRRESRSANASKSNIIS